ncbi:MAG TPA: permease [Acidobacteriaceae bacterium]|nr:permease [Acidobacteriaceae bacterium]
MSPTALNLRNRSLVRGTILVLGSLLLSFPLAGFPNDRPSLKLLIPAAFAVAGTWDTMRCLRGTWSFYHGAVVLLIYTDLMALFMILFLLLYPYAQWLL